MIDFGALGDKDLDLPDSEGEQVVAVAAKKPAGGAAKAGPKVKKIESIGNRKMEVLIVLGKQSCENLGNFQLMALKNTFGKDVNIKFMEGDQVWKYRFGRDLHDTEPTTLMLAKGAPFKFWFDYEFSEKDARQRTDKFKEFDDKVTCTYDPEWTEKSIDKLQDYCKKNTVDVCIGVFEGGIVIHLLVARLLKEDKEPPFRMAAFLGCLPIRDADYAAIFREKKSSLPTIHVFGRTDEYQNYGRLGAGDKARPAEEYYDHPVLMEHNEGHKMPTVEPRSREIYARIYQEALYQCGLQKVAPKRVLYPPKPTSFPILDMQGMLPRKIKVLAMAGGHTCIPVLKFQLATMRQQLGNMVEWTYVEGTKDWKWYKGEPTVTDMEEKIAGSNQLKNWFLDKAHEESERLNKDKQFDKSVKVEYYDVEEVVGKLREYIMTTGPYDVIIAFSQAAIMLNLLIGTMRKEDITKEKFDENRNPTVQRWMWCRQTAEQMPWRLSIMFAGMHIRDTRYMDLFDTKSPHPTVQVFGKDDEYYEYGRDGFGYKPQEEYYENPVVLTHDQGHQFPTEQPRAKQIYDKCIQEIYKHCGGKLD